MLTRFAVICLLLFSCFAANAEPRQIVDRQYHFRLKVPDAMMLMPPDPDVPGYMYYDSVVNVVLMVSGREVKHRALDNYIDCSNTELEELLKVWYADPELKLVSCDRSGIFPAKMKSLHLAVSILPDGYDRTLIYLLHHRGKDIQFTFTYKKANAVSLEYIGKIVSTLRLK